MKIASLTLEEILPIRHRVLWPDKPISFCRVPEDKQGSHYGVRLNGSVVCVASLYTEHGQARLRKFATVEEHQGRGIGSAMLKHLIQESRNLGLSVFWLDAREEAINFYLKFGFVIDSERFYKSGMPYFKMSKPLHTPSM